MCNYINLTYISIVRPTTFTISSFVSFAFLGQSGTVGSQIRGDKVSCVDHVDHQTCEIQSWYDTPLFQEVVVPSTKNDTLSLLLPNLTAHTVYEICVECRFTVGGYWSEQACFEITTNERAPDQGPEVTASGYYVLKTDDQLTRTVRLYWKVRDVLSR